MSAKDRLDLLMLSRRTMSEIAITRPSSTAATVDSSAQPRFHSGPMQVKMKIPRSQVAKLMEESASEGEIAEKIINMYLKNEVNTGGGSAGDVNAGQQAEHWKPSLVSSVRENSKVHHEAPGPSRYSLQSFQIHFIPKKITPAEAKNDFKAIWSILLKLLGITSRFRLEGTTYVLKDAILYAASFFTHRSTGVFFIFIAFTMFLPVMVMMPQKFAICFTLGCCFIIGSFFALKGPKNQLAHMFSKERLPFTVIFIGSMLGTLYVSMGLHSYILPVGDGAGDGAGPDTVESGQSVPVAAGAGDTNICGGIVQLYWERILGRSLDLNGQVHQIALKVKSSGL
ncbi:protein transport protein SFT2-like [Cucumis melo var. makuwa]|uniref:Vesicle transport protein n=1 Tax=Cucumis melo var. makuwa TaxID=1194695 RepID=A0A5A7U0F1_CUCMM|nr:protein transport protein SFT2-like [Cucumis melo var. makuwa]